MLFDQCVALAEHLDRPSIYTELCAALDNEEPKLLALVKNPKKVRKPPPPLPPKHTHTKRSDLVSISIQNMTLLSH